MCKDLLPTKGEAVTVCNDGFYNHLRTCLSPHLYPKKPGVFCGLPFAAFAASTTRQTE